MSVNKFRYDTEDVEKLAMANCMMILDRARVSDSGRIFNCKTCNRTFASFQALGGHTASHKRPKFVDGDSGLVRVSKTHQCSICKHEFYTGQALGGHMRRHRGENKAKSMEMASNCLSSTESERGVLPDLKKTIIEKRSLSSIESEIEEPDLKKTIIEKRILSSIESEIEEPDLNKTIIEKRILSSSDLERGEPDLKKTIIEKRILSSSESEIGEQDLKKRIRLFGIDVNLIPEEDDFDVDTKTKMFFV